MVKGFGCRQAYGNRPSTTPAGRGRGERRAEGRRWGRLSDAGRRTETAQVRIPRGCGAELWDFRILLGRQSSRGSTLRWLHPVWCGRFQDGRGGGGGGGAG